MSGPIPEWLLTACVVVAVFMVMFSLGLGILARSDPLGLVQGHRPEDTQREGVPKYALS